PVKLSYHLLILSHLVRSTLFPYTTLFRSVFSFSSRNQSRAVWRCWRYSWWPPGKCSKRTFLKPCPVTSWCILSVISFVAVVSLRSEEHTSELQSPCNIVCRLLLEKKTYGKTCRQDVLRGVDVPVMPDAAGRALPRPGGKAQGGEQVPARRAGLGAGVPAVDHDHVPSGRRRLVLHLAAELTPAAVADGLAQGAVADHVLDGEVFEDDHVVVADQAGRGAVQEVGAGRADFPVRAGDLGPGLGPVRRALLTAGQAPLIPGQVPFP